MAKIKPTITKPEPLKGRIASVPNISKLDPKEATTYFKPSELKVHPELEQRTVYLKVDELAKSIKEEGQQLPIGVWDNGNEKYIIYGYTRWHALQHEVCKGLSLWARVYRNISLEEARKISLIENFERNSLTIGDEARLVARLQKDNWSQSKIAAELGFDRRRVVRLQAVTKVVDAFPSVAEATHTEGFPLAAPEEFLKVEGSRSLDEDKVKAAFSRLVGEETVSVGTFVSDVKRTLKAMRADGDAQDDEPEKGMFYKNSRGTIKVNISLKRNPSLEEVDSALEALKKATAETKKLRKAFEKTPS